MCTCTSSIELKQRGEFYKQKLTIGSKLAALAEAVPNAIRAGTDHAVAAPPLNVDFGLFHKNFARLRAKKIFGRAL
jgi:hypothetical protein